MTTKPAGASPVDRGVGRPVPEREDLYWRLHGLSKALESSGRIDEHEHAGAYATILDAMNALRDTRTRSQKLADAGFVRRPGLQAMEMRAALELIAAPVRPDGTWNRDRAACQELAAEALGRYDDSKTPNNIAQRLPAGRTE